MSDNNNTNKVVVQQQKPVKINRRSKVKCIVQGAKFLEAVYIHRKSAIGIKKLNGKEYVVLRTGEIKDFEEKNTKQVKNLNKTFNELRYLIRTNFTENGKNQLFITLTYIDNMTNEEQLYKDFKEFMKRLKYRYPDDKFDYIVVAEPQGRGAWHMHLMLKTDKPTLFIKHEIISQVWGDENIPRQLLIKALKMNKKFVYNLSLDDAMSLIKSNKVELPSKFKPIKGHGFTTTEELRSDDVGTYYVAYFTDLTDESKNSSSSTKSKKRKKGARLHFYPKNFKFYRCSRGIERPSVEERRYGEVLDEYGEPKYIQTYSLDKQIDGLLEKRINLIQKESFIKD